MDIIQIIKDADIKNKQFCNIIDEYDLSNININSYFEDLRRIILDIFNKIPTTFHTKPLETITINLDKLISIRVSNTDYNSKINESNISKYMLCDISMFIERYIIVSSINRNNFCILLPLEFTNKEYNYESVYTKILNNVEKEINIYTAHLYNESYIHVQSDFRKISEFEDIIEFNVGDVKTEVTFNSGNLIIGNCFKNISTFDDEHNEQYSICYRGGMKNTATVLGKKGIGYIQTGNTSISVIQKDNELLLICKYGYNDDTDEEFEFSNGDYGYKEVAYISCDIWRVELVDTKMFKGIDKPFVDVYDKKTFKTKVEPGIYELEMCFNGEMFNEYELYGKLKKKD